MDDLIFVGKIADIFKLSGIPGIVVVPESPWATNFSLGSQFTLIKPNLDTLLVEVASLLSVRTALSIKNRASTIAINSDNLTKEDVPIGSTLWIAPIVHF